MNTSFDHKTVAPAQRAAQRESQSAKAFPSRTIVHAKLEMTEPGDHDEQEANDVANTIVNGGKIALKISSGGGSSSGITVSQQMESQLSQLQGGGRQMPEGLRNMMESGFGQDFSQVRLHTDSEAASLSNNIHAKAFTLGNDIYFNQGQFSPNTPEGQRLVAHELTHVVQGSGKVGKEDKEYTPIPLFKDYIPPFKDHEMEKYDEYIKKIIAITLKKTIKQKEEPEFVKTLNKIKSRPQINIMDIYDFGNVGVGKQGSDIFAGWKIYENETLNTDILFGPSGIINGFGGGYGGGFKLIWRY